MGTVSAPWSDEQVDSLNAYQAAGVMHPFTCPGEHVPASPNLYATAEGWRCRSCSYTQTWAHDFMADDSWRDPDPSMFFRTFTTPRPEEE